MPKLVVVQRRARKSFCWRCKLVLEKGMKAWRYNVGHSKDYRKYRCETCEEIGRY